MRDLIDAFFRERSIVNHHIASFNDFLPTIDNPNSRKQRIVDNLRSSPEDERRGVIKLDEDRTEGDVIEIRIGRKRDDRGRIDLEAKPTITLGLPVVKEANGATHPLTPMEARLRNLNYTAPIYLLHGHRERHRAGAGAGPHRELPDHGEVETVSPLQGEHGDGG